MSSDNLSIKGNESSSVLSNSLIHINYIYEKIKVIVSDYDFYQYKFYPAKGKRMWEKYFLSRLYKILHDREYIYIYEEFNGLPYLLACKVPKWDEEHFGFKLASIDFVFYPKTFESIDLNKIMLERLIKELKSMDVRFCSARINGNMITLIHNLESLGFKYYENILWPIVSSDNIQTSMADGIRLMEVSDLDRVMDIAQTCQYEKGHFYCDRNFSKESIDSMYIKWIETAWANKKPIAVLQYQKEIVGFFVFYIDMELSNSLGFKYGRMNLLSLKQGFRGKGLGSILFNGTMILMKEMGVEYIDSGYSTKNHISAKLHAKNLFYSVYEEVTFHLWL